MRIVKVKFLKTHAGHKPGTTGMVLEPTYFELKKQGIVNLIGDTDWRVPDEEEE